LNKLNDNWIDILEEGLLPRCNACGIFQHSIGIRHKQSEQCRNETAIKQECLENEKNKVIIKVTIFMIDATPIKKVDNLEE
jgi:hypothetical protein